MNTPTCAEHQTIDNSGFHDSDKRSNTATLQKLNRALHYFCYFFGACAIVFALLSLATNMNLVDILLWIGKYFGLGFSLLFSLLLGAGIWSIFRLNALSIKDPKRLDSGTSSLNINSLLGQRVFWYQVGMQTANGISTLALTFTLLGISLGIGSLSEQSLNPENVNNVISILTTQFSMAFMTTVVGLPTATALRAYLGILHAKQDMQYAKFDTQGEGKISATTKANKFEES
jgi:hypothetical protein